jgi:phosphoribosylamine---glycine ligase
MMPINVNFEHKPLFPGNIGPATGEMGTCMYWSGPNKVFAATLAKLEKKLRDERYVGYIDVNCIVNSNGIYPLEFTARFGYPTISIQQEGMLMPIGELLCRLAEGTVTRFKARSGFQVGVRIVVPPFPFKDPETFQTSSKDAVIIFKKPTRDGIHIEDVKAVDNEWLVTGTSGVVLIVVGLGSTMKQAQRQVYNRIDNIMIPNMYYRKDIGDRWFEDFDRLHTWGYLRD